MIIFAKVDKIIYLLKVVPDKILGGFLIFEMNIKP